MRGHLIPSQQKDPVEVETSTKKSQPRKEKQRSFQSTTREIQQAIQNIESKLLLIFARVYSGSRGRSERELVVPIFFSSRVDVLHFLFVRLLLEKARYFLCCCFDTLMSFCATNIKIGFCGFLTLIFCRA
jgi:hypothetical protein